MAKNSGVLNNGACMRDQATPKAIFFDYDDTLVATIPAIWAKHKHIAKTFYNRHLEDADIQQHWGKPFTQMIKLLYDTEDGETAVKHNLALHGDFQKTIFEETIYILQELQNANITIGLVTAATKLSLEKDFTALKIPKSLFSYIQTEEHTQFHKPDPRVFDPTIEWLAGRGISPSETLYVGDSLHDMKAAKGAGFHFIGKATGLITPDAFRACEVHAINSLSELLEVHVPLLK